MTEGKLLKDECLAENAWLENESRKILQWKETKVRDSKLKDEEIVSLYLDRSETAILETKNKYGGYLNQVAYNILRDADDAEEIVNDTYMGAWKSIPPTIPDSLKFFLARIARNLSFDRLDYRNAGKRKAIYVELDEAIPDGGETPEQILEHKELGRVLNAFLGKLDKKTCAMFVARYFYSYTIAEVAKRYDVPQRQTKYLLLKTRARLQAYLEKEGIRA